MTKLDLELRQLQAQQKLLNLMTQEQKEDVYKRYIEYQLDQDISSVQSEIEQKQNELSILISKKGDK